MKRFTETEKWRDPWFRSLSAPAKLVFFYLLDNCNNAGFHELDRDLMVILTGMKVEHVDGALKALNRGIKGPFEGWYWIRRFLRHQKNESINPENPAHKQILVLIRDQLNRFQSCQEFQQFLLPFKGLLSPIGTGIGKGTGKKGIAKGKSFSPPSLEEAKTYASEISFGDVESWHDHFTSNGWRVSGKTPMQDWRSAMRNAKRHPIRSNGSQVGDKLYAAPKRSQRELPPLPNPDTIDLPDEVKSWALETFESRRDEIAKWHVWGDLSAEMKRDWRQHQKQKIPGYHD